MHPRQRALRNAVAVVVVVAPEVLGFVEVVRRQHLAAIGLVTVIPLEPRHHPVVHADVEIADQKRRRLEALGDVERLGRELERLARVRGIQADMTRVAV